MNFDQYAIFASCVRNQGFAGAARELGLAPSTVAKSITRLEARLKIKLFHRTTRLVQLTPDGAHFYARLQRIADDIAALEDDTLSLREAPHGVVKLSLPRVLGRKVALPALLALGQQYPGLAFDLRFSDTFSDLLAEGLCAAVRIGELPSSSLMARPVGFQQLILCASPAYLGQHGVPGRREDLAGHTKIAFRLGKSGRDLAWQLRHGPVDEPQVGLRCDDGDAMVVAAALGAGLVQVPGFMVEGELQRGELVEVMAAERPAPTPIHIVFPENRMVPMKLRVVIDALHAALALTRPPQDALAKLPN